MSAVILALLETSAGAAKVLSAARRAAQLMGATRINVLAIRPPAPAGKSGVGGQDFADAGTLPAAARMAALRATYQDWAGRPTAGNTATEWIELEGRTGPLLEEWGERCDLIVLQRPGLKDFERERRAVQTALFDTGRPVLVVPQDAQPMDFGRCVAVAWRDDVRTTRAVMAALHWLADTARIHVIAGAKKWEAPPALPAVFAEHGIAAELHVLPMNGQRGFGEALLVRAQALQVDLILLGAFAHPMLFGPVLGGVTKHMLTRADVPVLMRY